MQHLGQTVIGIKIKKPLIKLTNLKVKRRFSIRSIQSHPNLVNCSEFHPGLIRLMTLLLQCPESPVIHNGEFPIRELKCDLQVKREVKHICGTIFLRNWQNLYKMRVASRYFWTSRTCRRGLGVCIASSWPSDDNLM